MYLCNQAMCMRQLVRSCQLNLKGRGRLAMGRSLTFDKGGPGWDGIYGDSGKGVKFGAELEGGYSGDP